MLFQKSGSLSIWIKDPCSKFKCVTGGTTFTPLEELDPNDVKYEIECSLSEAEYIREHLANLLTTEYRSIWFTYPTIPPKQPLESFQANSSKISTGKSWTVIFNMGTMLSYDTFIGHILNNRHPSWIRVEKDDRGRAKTVVIEKKQNLLRLRFAVDSLHRDVLFKYGQQHASDPVHLVFMLKALPQIEQRLQNGNYSRVCNSFGSGIDIDTISRCSDLCVQFQSRADAWCFLQQLPLFGDYRELELNYAELNFPEPPNNQSLATPHNDQQFPSELGYYAMTMLRSLGYLFEDKYSLQGDLASQFTSLHQKSPEYFYEFCCTLWTRLRENHCRSILSLLNQYRSEQKNNANRVPSSSYRVPHVTVTPLRILYHPMHMTTGHRAMRHYEKYPDYKWMLLNFREEDYSQKITNLHYRDTLLKRYQRVLEQGITSERNSPHVSIYHYFGSSGSQMKNQDFWFLALAENLQPDTAAERVHQARMELGDLSTIRNVATYVARVGLYLTTSKPTDIKFTFHNPTRLQRAGLYLRSKLFSRLRILFERDKIDTIHKAYLIEDIERNGYCFTDGIGTMGLGVAKEIAKSIGINVMNDKDVPSAYQVRVAGCKGMLSIDPRSTPEDFSIKVRKSMMKFPSDDWTLEIVAHSRMMCLSLNNQIIRLLYDLNNENKAVFESLQNRCILQGTWHPPEEEYLNIFDTKDLDQKKDEYRRRGCRNAKDFLLRNRIPLPVDEARSLFGIADETDSLEQGQCFIQYQTTDGKSYRVVKGDVLVTKNPCLYPGDIRCLKAVDIPSLRACIRNCIVFPTRGARPHPNEISGSDLDGDQYWVYWGKELTVKGIVAPLSYKAAKKTTVPKVTPPLILNHILNTLGDQTSGIISNTHSVIADKHPEGTKSSECKMLAELFSQAIDAVKTGEQIDMKPVFILKEKWGETYPKWMKKEDKPVYESKSINGHLFSRAQDLRIDGRHYKYISHKYEKVNSHTVVEMPMDDYEQDHSIKTRLPFFYFISNLCSRYAVL